MRDALISLSHSTRYLNFFYHHYAFLRDFILSLNYAYCKRRKKTSLVPMQNLCAHHGISKNINKLPEQREELLY